MKASAVSPFNMLPGFVGAVPGMVASLLMPTRTRDTVPPEALADPDSRFLEVDGLKVHYKVSGQGEPVFVLLHGFAASTFTWRKVMAPIGELGTAIAFDRPAFGLTERPMRWAGENPYGPKAQIDLTIAMLDYLGVEKGILVGNSAGGTVALATALTYPDRVEALVLVDPAIYIGDGIPDPLRWLLLTPQLYFFRPATRENVGNPGSRNTELGLARPRRTHKRRVERVRKAGAGRELGSGPVGVYPR